MVKPKNGQNYGSFIFGQYFNRVVVGDNAAKQATLKVIELINALPATITLADEAAVIAARDAYNKIPEIEQKALVSNYTKLTSAESTIAYLNFKNDQTQGEETVTPEKKGCSSVVSAYSAILTSVACLTVMGAARKRKTASALRSVEDNNEKEEN